MHASKGHYSPQQKELIESYLAGGLKLLRLHGETKRPVGTRWQEKPGLDLGRALLAIRSGDAIGVQAGEVSGWISCVDADTPESVRLAPLFLPKEMLRSGKGGVASHYVCRARGLGYECFDDLDGTRLIDLKASSNGKGHQFVVAPSVHARKGPYEWLGGFDPHGIPDFSAKELRERVGRLAAATLISRHLPDKGRHRYSLALAGFLLRGGLDEPTTTKILRGAWWCKDAPSEGMEAVGRNVSDTAHKLRDGEPVTGGRTLEELVTGLAGKLKEFLRLRGAGSASSPGEALPTIVVNDRPLRDVGDEALQALVARNDPPTLFARTGRTIRLGADEHDAPIIEEASESVMRHHLTRSANFVREIHRKSGTEHTDVSPPRDVVQDVMSVPHLPFPPLIGVPRTPFFRADGSLVSEPGYDASSRLYYVPVHRGFAVAVPSQPSADDLASAIALLDEAVGDFPYSDEASAANTIALMLTPILRNVMSGPVPLALLDKPVAGTGGSLLAEVVSILATGAPAGMMGSPRNDEEVRKQITSALMRGNLVITIDNVSGRLEAPSLSRALTSEFWEDRILGRSEIVRLPQRACWICSGNNLQVGGDLPRRCYWVRLDAGVERPWERKGFRHPDLKSWVSGSRARLVGALLTLGRNWFAEGKPQGSASIGSFESWSRVIGGVLGAAGVQGFLGNLDAMYERAADGTGDWTGFLEAWREVYGDDPKTTKQIAADVHSTEQARLLDALPEEFGTPDPDRPDTSLSRKLGNNFNKREGRPHGERRLLLKTVGKRNNAVLWTVAEAPRPTGDRISLSSLLSLSPPNLGAPARAHGEDGRTETQQTQQTHPEMDTSDGEAGTSDGKDDGGTPRESLSIEQIARELRRPSSGPRINHPLYIAGETTLEILTKSVLVAIGLDTEEWLAHAGVVEQAASDPANHPPGCACGECG
jgi:Bifunctional DNA primase/polymerase, N-terminal